ncbi:Fur family transcriptional regulator [Pseudobutyrivibrio sp.]|uniref:Fur family transcriptional regulator n=1 Tax=Pseudobutyrivibrio sp. TaxID=2014367 RepID=UPI0025D5D868|nr:transcriptional repressor [Pseudobutyrivibrio sp.]
MYKTKARDAIIKYLEANTEKRLTAREVFDGIKDSIEGVNRTTVYRNLDKLCDQGELVRFKDPNQDAWYYQFSAKDMHCDKHIHARCSRCGRVFHLDDEFVVDFIDKLQTEYKLDLNTAKTMLVVQCKKCNRIAIPIDK